MTNAYDQVSVASGRRLRQAKRDVKLQQRAPSRPSLQGGCQSSIGLEDDEPPATPSRWVNLSAFEAAKFGEDTKDRTGGERQGQAKRLRVDGRDWMLEKLVQIERIAGTVLTVVRMCRTALINMLCPPFHCYLASASKSKLKRPRV